MSDKPKNIAKTIKEWKRPILGNSEVLVGMVHYGVQALGREVRVGGWSEWRSQGEENMAPREEGYVVEWNSIGPQNNTLQV